MNKRSGVGKDTGVEERNQWGKKWEKKKKKDWASESCGTS